MSLSVSVIIVTYNRPDYLRRCLDCLGRQTVRPEQIIVVDSSTDSLTRQLVQQYPGVLYLGNNEHSCGHMTEKRNIGMSRASGDILAFLDDDAFAFPDWCEQLKATYASEDIGAVGGRALNNQPGESETGKDQIGRFAPDGMLDGYFAADPGQILEVYHIIGCNMSFRRSVMARLGGFRTDFPGTSLREDSDMCFRVKALGYRILFNPAAAVEHVGAPHVVGRRFDTRYNYYAQRNHLTLLIRNFGLSSPYLWKYLIASVSSRLRAVAGSLLRLAVTLAGTATGLVAGVCMLSESGTDPVRHDPRGLELSRALSDPSNR